ncbi:MAG: OmpA family protein [Burkholderiales bacterium]|nr:OmpA family protein [Burkholderiales bacterium]
MATGRAAPCGLWRRRGAALASAALVTLLLGACASSTRLDPLPPVENRGGARGPADAASSASALPTAQSRVASVELGRTGPGGTASDLSPLGGSGVKPGGVGADALAGGNGKVIYFDFNSYVVRDDYKPVIDAQARRLAADRSRKLLLEGHTDERGGSEFNLALGQKRAEAVLRALALLGAQDSQLEAVSYGKERPAVGGSDEAAWAMNRRVELRDR